MFGRRRVLSVPERVYDLDLPSEVERRPLRCFVRSFFRRFIRSFFRGLLETFVFRWFADLGIRFSAHFVRKQKKVKTVRSERKHKKENTEITTNGHVYYFPFLLFLLFSFYCKTWNLKNCTMVKFERLVCQENQNWNIFVVFCFELWTGLPN